MARVTVEDCIVKVPNRFDLVMLASQRARDISAGAKETVKRDNDKGPVVALREIAEGTLKLPELEDSLVRGLQRHVVYEEDDEEELESELLLSRETAAEMAAGMAAASAAADEDVDSSAETDEEDR